MDFIFTLFPMVIICSWWFTCKIYTVNRVRLAVNHNPQHALAVAGKVAARLSLLKTVKKKKTKSDDS